MSVYTNHRGHFSDDDRTGRHDWVPLCPNDQSNNTFRPYDPEDDPKELSVRAAEDVLPSEDLWWHLYRNAL